MIDPDSIPMEQKSSIILLRNDLEASETLPVELRKVMSGMCPYMDGFEHISNGIKYADAEKWGKAAKEFAKASDMLSGYQTILEELKDSEYSKVSIGAIEICGFLTQEQKDLPHLEAGYRYMEKGRYSQAEAEFDKLTYYYY